MLIADTQGIEPGALCRRGSLDHPARSLTGIFHVRVIARERDPDSHSVIPSPDQTSEKRRAPLLQLVLDHVQAGAGARVVEIAARRPGGANRSNHLVAHLDRDASAEQQQMRQFE